MAIKYHVVISSNFDSFKSIVNDYINRGWLLQGGVATMLKNDGSTMYSQAMVFNKD